MNDYEARTADAEAAYDLVIDVARGGTSDVTALGSRIRSVLG